MQLLVQRLIDTVNGSLWFLPSAIVLACGAAALGLTQVDRQIDPDGSGLAWLAFGGGPEGARGVLSSIATSMMTVTGVIFSITIVVLALAAQQYTPRVLRQFRSDRTNQVVLGSFLGTWIYALLVLRSIRAEGFGEFIPHFAVAGGILLALVSLGLLIHFVHHTAVSIQPSFIVSQIAGETSGVVERLFPEPLGEGAPEEEVDEDSLLPEAPGQEVRAARSGYLRSVDNEALMKAAGESELVVRLERRSGHFVPEGAALVTAWPAHRVTETARERLRGAFDIGRSRSLEQDPEFGILQIVDIAVRALSPGINDPTTAVVCLDHLGVILRQAASRAIPSPYRKDEGGRVRVIARGADFESMAELAFSEIRRHAAAEVSVSIHLLKVIEGVAERAPGEARRAVLREHVRRVLAAEDLVRDPADGEEIRRRAGHALAALSPGTPFSSPEPKAAPGAPVSPRGTEGGRRRAPASG